MHPDVHTMAALATIDQRVRDAARARLVAQARASRRRSRHHDDSSGVSA